MNTYPIKILIRAQEMQQLRKSEHAAYQDAQRVSTGGVVEYPMAYSICLRHDRMIEIRDEAEADEMFYAVSSGTFAQSHYETAKRIAKILRPYAKPKTVALWPKVLRA